MSQFDESMDVEAALKALPDTKAIKCDYVNQVVGEVQILFDDPKNGLGRKAPSSRVVSCLVGALAGNVVDEYHNARIVSRLARVCLRGPQSRKLILKHAQEHPSFIPKVARIFKRNHRVKFPVANDALFILLCLQHENGDNMAYDVLTPQVIATVISAHETGRVKDETNVIYMKTVGFYIFCLLQQQGRLTIAHYRAVLKGVLEIGELEHIEAKGKAAAHFWSGRMLVVGRGLFKDPELAYRTYFEIAKEMNSTQLFKLYYHTSKILRARKRHPGEVTNVFAELLFAQLTKTGEFRYACELVAVLKDACEDESGQLQMSENLPADVKTVIWKHAARLLYMARKKKDDQAMASLARLLPVLECIGATSWLTCLHDEPFPKLSQLTSEFLLSEDYSIELEMATMTGVSELPPDAILNQARPDYFHLLIRAIHRPGAGSQTMAMVLLKHLYELASSLSRTSEAIELLTTSTPVKDDVKNRAAKRLKVTETIHWKGAIRAAILNLLPKFHILTDHAKITLCQFFNVRFQSNAFLDAAARQCAILEAMSCAYEFEHIGGYSPLILTPKTFIVKRLIPYLRLPMPREDRRSIGGIEDVLAYRQGIPKVYLSYQQRICNGFDCITTQDTNYAENEKSYANNEGGEEDSHMEDDEPSERPRIPGRKSKASLFKDDDCVDLSTATPSKRKSEHEANAELMRRFFFMDEAIS